MSSEANNHSRGRPSRLAATIKRLIRTRITAGIITILPILITLWVVRLIFVWMRDSSQWVIQVLLVSNADLTSPEPPPVLKRLAFDWDRWLLLQELGLPHRQEQFFELMPWFVQWGIAFFSVFLTLFILYIIGLFAANIVGRRLITTLEQFVDRVPVVKTVYRGLKQILASFSGDQTQSFRRAALVPFPQERMRCVGFITNIFKDSVTGEELCSVFIATTPNPTTGYLQILRRKDITELNWSVEEAIRTVMSGGILKPDFLTIVPNRELPDGLPEGVGPTDLPPANELQPPASGVDDPTEGPITDGADPRHPNA